VLIVRQALFPKCVPNSGSNARGMYVFVYYQLCPNCKEPIVEVKEQNDLDALNIDIKDLILLTKPK
jgi:hypothetical protein